MDFDKMMKECMKPHALAHSLTGAGVGLLLVAFLPVLAQNVLMAGIVVLVAGIVFDFLAQSKK